MDEERADPKKKGICIKNGGNATQAAIAAKYSEKTAYSQGQRLLKNDDILNYIARTE